MIPARRILAKSALTARLRAGASDTSAIIALSSSSPSSRAAFSSASYTTTRPAATRTSPQTKQPRPRWETCTPSGNGLRRLTTAATGSKIWTFEEIQSLSSSSDPERPTLIDVREPGELSSTGRIPGAVNVPITTWPDSFHIAAREFEDRFGFPRPDPARPVVFYCKAGVRSRAAAAIAREAGWSDVGEYPGSWLEWSAKGGDVQR